MIKSIRVIGDGGAFDTDRINSSFFIETDSSSILFDCGYNVFHELKRLDLVKDCDTIIISHTDDDHMGSVKSLIYMRYFMYGKSTQVVCGTNGVKEYFDGINWIYESSGYTKADIVRLFANNLTPNNLGCNITTVEAIHHVKAIGIICSDTDKVIVISGDTKANKKLEDTIINSWGIEDPKLLIFHDYSYWNAPSRNVHACEGDFSVEYSDSFKSKAIKYHNDRCDLAGIEYRFNGETWEANDGTAG